jgi:D-3-phosphoglycerate dehydrogenase
MSQTRILLLENIHPVAKHALEKEGFVVESESRALSEDELIQRVQDFQVLGIRSKTELSENFFQSATHLQAVGAFCIGTNQIDLRAANRVGVPVFNAPYSNTRSVAELVLCEIIALSRQLGDRSQNAHKGIWQKSADGSREVRGKTLGIIGYGHIGSQLSILGEGLGLRVIFYDIIKKLPLGNSSARETLDDLLSESDFVSLHVPETDQTKDMIGPAQLAAMKPGSFLINASRGTVVDIEALAAALRSGRIAGCAVDVFPEEPASNKEQFVSPLQGLSNVILTPHIGGSTEEAQEAIGREVAQSFLLYLKHGVSLGAVNFPHLSPPQSPLGRRIVNVHRNVPGVLSEINKIVSSAGANITLQMLATDSQIGYLILDIEGPGATALSQQIRALKTSIRTHVVPGYL